MNPFQPNSQDASIPHVLHGRIERVAHFESAYVTRRHIDVWLPDDYSSDGRYAVLYMNDGQMLFDRAITWNQQSWGAAEVMGKLSRTGQIRDCIVVGIWNSSSGRHTDYFPQKPFEALPAAYRESLKRAVREDGTPVFAADIQSDNYLKFITQELKPYIDHRYATLPAAENTFIAGSSMGGLISMYALCEYPEVFGGAACLSTHWIGIFTDENNPIPDAFMAYLDQHLPSPSNHRIYFDYGTETLDAFYEPYQLQVDQIMSHKGYDLTNWQTHKFEGAAHSEEAWRERLHIPITFLLHT